MPRITIELLPGGNEARKQNLATGKITNLSTGSLSQGSYFLDLRDKAGRPWRHRPSESNEPRGHRLRFSQ